MPAYRGRLLSVSRGLWIGADSFRISSVSVLWLCIYPLIGRWRWRYWWEGDIVEWRSFVSWFEIRINDSALYVSIWRIFSIKKTPLAQSSSVCGYGLFLVVRFILFLLASEDVCEDKDDKDSCDYFEDGWLMFLVYAFDIIPSSVFIYLSSYVDPYRRCLTEQNSEYASCLLGKRPI